MTDDEILASLRSAILVIDRFGTIEQVAGAIERVLGFAAIEMIGCNAIDFVAASHVPDAAGAFAAGGERVVRNEPDPFIMALRDSDDVERRIEVVASRRDTDRGQRWVVQLTSVREQSLTFEAMNEHAEGADGLSVAVAVADRLDVRSPEGVRIDSFVLHNHANGVFNSMESAKATPELASIVELHLLDRSAVWNSVGLGHHATCPLDELPVEVARAAWSEGFEVANIGVAAVGNDPGIALLSFGNHSYAFDSGVRLLCEQSLDVITMALERDRASEILRHAAEHDALTGLLNCERFVSEMSSRAGFDGDVVLVVDVDQLKVVNEEFGYAAGDAVLVEVGQRIASACRPADIVARLGGDEFAVLLPNIGEEAAAVIGCRIIQRVAQPLPDDMGPDTVSVTLAMGLAATSAEALIGSADATMFAHAAAAISRR